MTKKKFIIIFSVLVLAFVGVLVAYIINGAIEKQKTPELGEEFVFYSKTFDLELSKDESYYIVSDLTDSGKSLDTVKFPSTVDGIPVTIWHINNQGVSYKNATTIIIPSTIEYIGKDKIPSSTYGDSFITCTNSELVNFQVEPGNKKYASRDGILYSADYKTLLRFPNSKSIDMALKVEINEGVEEIYDNAFYYNLYIHQVYFPNSLKKIGIKAFWHCDNLTNVLFKEGLESIGERCFGYCQMQNLELPLSLKKIETNAFSSCSSLNRCVIHKDCTDIGNKIFTANAATLNVVTEEENIPFLKTVIQESVSGKIVKIISLEKEKEG